MRHLPLVMVGLLAGSFTAPAQFNFNFAFNSGSSGAYGPLNVTSNTTLNMPSNGIFNCTTINVSTGAVLRFNRNLASTPVYLLAQGDVKIDGTIDVSGGNAPGEDARVGGEGGPGGFDGGFPGFNSLPPGDGYGPGGGKAGVDSGGQASGVPESAGAGSYSSAARASDGGCQGYASTNKGAIYGSPLLVPMVGGSGGGGTPSPGGGGGGGGGALLIASSTRIDLAGAIQANGGEGITYGSGCFGGPDSHLNPGSGGAIRLVAPVVAGSGTLSALGPTLGRSVNNDGRIRIDSIDRRSIGFVANPPAPIGTYMVAFPPSRLDIIRVGTTNIVEGSGAVTIQFPNDSTTNRSVVLQARNFNAIITSLVVLTPQNGPSTTYTNIIDNLASNPATNSVTVGIPPNNIVTINAWTQVP